MKVTNNNIQNAKKEMSECLNIMFVLLEQGNREVKNKRNNLDKFNVSQAITKNGNIDVNTVKQLAIKYYQFLLRKIDSVDEKYKHVNGVTELVDKFKGVVNRKIQETNAIQGITRT